MRRNAAAAAVSVVLVKNAHCRPWSALGASRRTLKGFSSVKDQTRGLRFRRPLPGPLDCLRFLTAVPYLDLLDCLGYSQLPGTPGISSSVSYVVIRLLAVEGTLDLAGPFQEALSPIVFIVR